MSGGEEIAIVVVDYNAGEALKACLASIERQRSIDWEAIVVRNGERRVTDDLRPLAREVVSPRNLGFASGANLGLAGGTQEWVALVNPDVVLQPDTLAGLRDFLKTHPHAAAVTPKLCLAYGGVQPYWFGEDPTVLRLVANALRKAVRLRTNWDVETPRKVDWISGACLVARRAAFRDVGGMDERFFLYFEDADWCRRCRLAGWDIWIDPDVRVIHQSRPSYHDVGRRRLYLTSLRSYLRKWQGPLASGVVSLGQGLAAWIGHDR